ncbi:MAG: arylsulfatase [Armatimonadetes bacterium]|nr:arylsulfatase [Armatimonadota bacterium]
MNVPTMLCAVSALTIPLTAAAARANAAEMARKPNIIFILADDLGYGDVGCYGQQMILTPSIDRMAAEGVRFTQAYSGATICAPSRCALMTGYHTGHTVIRGNKGAMLGAKDTTVAKVLQETGYSTALIGKWGLGLEGEGTPRKQGFDYFYGYRNQTLAHNYYPKTLWRNDEEVELAPGSYSHDLFTQEALQWVRQHKEKPFFLYLAYTIPHANNEKTGETGNGMEVPSDEPYSDKPWPQPEKNKAAMITRMDRDIGKLLDLLKAEGLDDNTVVFFTSDNGPHREGGGHAEFFQSSGPLRGIKRDQYEGGIRVPMAVRWPGKIAPGQVSDQVWAFWDFLPTAAELAGAKCPENIDGLSMAPALLGKPQKQHDYLYWEFHEKGFQQAARKGDWKAVRLAPGKPTELYDLSRDLGEKKNLAEQYPEVIKEMDEILDSAWTPSADFPVDRSVP